MRGGTEAELSLSYESLAAFSDLDTASFAFNATSLAEADVFTSFHNFQLRTDVVVALQQSAGGTGKTMRSAAGRKAEA